MSSMPRVYAPADKAAWNTPTLFVEPPNGTAGDWPMKEPLSATWKTSPTRATSVTVILTVPGVVTTNGMRPADQPPTAPPGPNGVGAPVPAGAAVLDDAEPVALARTTTPA